MDDLADLLSDLASGDESRAQRACARFAAFGAQALDAPTPGAQSPVETAAAGLRRLLASPDADTRWWAVRALAELGAPQAIPHLISTLRDPHPSVRQCAALGFGEHPDELAIPALLDALADSDSLTARLAANALVKSGAPAVPGLVEVMQKGTSKASLEAARALALIGDTRAIPALFEALDGDSILMEYWANEGLERMGVGMTFFKP